VGHVRGHRRHVVDDVDEQFPAGDPGQPAFVDDLDVELVLLEISQHLQRVAGLGEYVDILGRAIDAGVDGERVSAGEKEGNLRLGHQPENFRIESLRRGRRLDQRALLPVFDLSLHAPAQRQAGRRVPHGGAGRKAAKFAAQRRGRSGTRPAGPEIILSY
jgi:hypothetical protein